MNLKINSRHVEVTPAMRTHLEAGLAKIRKHFDHVIEPDAETVFLADAVNAGEKFLGGERAVNVARGERQLSHSPHPAAENSSSKYASSSLRRQFALSA